MEEGPSRKKGKYTAVQKKGLVYEKQVARLFKRRSDLEGKLFVSQWIMYEDVNGLGWAQVDLYLVQKEVILLVECKLSQTERAHAQLLYLYLPLLRKIYLQQIVCLQICKYMQCETDRMVLDPKDLIDYPRFGVWTLHWMNLERLSAA